ncbi:MAG: carboxypeptidase-like regulatory domain-containing protein [Planctomycetaceae bacterium]|nr:carboxypeptidase-like regulatory domain-containing protein [Planctomycetaceae bacterium]
MKALRIFVVTGIGLLICTGCGSDTGHLPKTVPAKGIVTLDGKPVEGAQVVLVAEAQSAHGAFGASDASGRFSLRAFEEKDGAVPGTYKVQISKTVVKELSPDKAANLDGGAPLFYDYGVPPKYTGFQTSGLTATVPESGTSDLKFELSSK